MAKHRLVSVALCLWLLALGNPCLSQEVGDFQELTIGVSAEKYGYILGEPVYLKITVSNTTTKPIMWYSDFSTMHDTVGVKISKDGKDFRIYCGPGWGRIDFIYGEPDILKPGKSVDSDIITILYNRCGGGDKGYGIYLVGSGYVFSHPVKYFIKVTLEGPNQGRIESSPIMIEVTEPSGDDAKIWEMIKGEEFAYFMHSGDVGYGSKIDSKEVSNTLKEILTQYPKNIYLPYIRVALIQYYTQKEVMGNPLTSEEKQYIEEVVNNKEILTQYPIIGKTLIKYYTQKAFYKSITPEENQYLNSLKEHYPSEEKKDEEKIKKTEIIIKGEGCLEKMVSFIEEETGIEISIEKVWLPAMEKGSPEEWLKVEDMMLNKHIKYSFKAKVKEGDKEEMLNIAKSFLKEALTQLKLTKKIDIEEREGKLYLVPR